jgi:4-hydroxysphinganine ceramide fatty acyl 2-hydroxylase
MGLIANALTRLATSHFNYWFGFMVDAAVAVSFWMLALRYVRGTWATWISVLLAGLSLYGLMEYLFHRWIYHGGRSPAATGHLMHHEDPQALIGLPFFFPATVAFALWFLFRRLLGEGEASLMMAAVATNFLYYGLLHHSHHHGRLKAGYFQRMRSYHHIHHHFPDRNFGLTMTLWDWVFGTHYLSGKRSRTGGFRTGWEARGRTRSMRRENDSVNVSAGGFQGRGCGGLQQGTHWEKSPRPQGEDGGSGFSCQRHQAPPSWLRQRASLRRLSASCPIVVDSEPRPRRGWPSSTSSRAGATPTVATPPRLPLTD